jgi:aspartate/methionine/tyrosine aminotransferase
MKLAPFLLDEWLDTKTAVPGAIRHHLAASTGPHWTVKELLDLEPGALERVLGIEVVYSRAKGSDELRGALAEMLGADPEEIQITTGASEALHVLFAWAAEPGANVVMPAPCFPPTSAVPRALGLEVRTYRLRRENGFAVDLDEVRSLLDGRTRLLLVNSPHNPTGAALSEGELAALHDLAAERGIGFVSDEVYSPISAGTPPASAVRLPRATIVSDFSKAFCLSGTRVGFLLERDARRRAYATNAREMFTVTNAPLEEALAAVAVRNRETIFARANETVRPNLAELERFLARHADLFRWVRPSGGMIAFPWLASGEDSRPLCEYLAERGVLVVPGDCFGAPDHVRIGFGATAPAEFARALSVLDELLLERRAAA